MPKRTKPFWDNVDKDGPVPAHMPHLGPCWVWIGTRLKSGGYGAFGSKRAHRVGYELQVGPIPEGLGILHRCDNPPCVRGSHLFAGTQKENAADAKSKGMLAHQKHPDVFHNNGKRLLNNKKVRGEEHGCAKLTEADVRKIREAHTLGDSNKSIARAYGVSDGAIDNIIAGRAWKHVA